MTSIYFDKNNSGFQVGISNGPVYLHPASPSIAEQRLSKAEDRQYRDTLQATDPSLDKARIEEDKGGLLRDSYIWVLDDVDFQRWRDVRCGQLLWIKGDPGKGKTMLLCGIIDELSKMAMSHTNISFFFCQATNSRINSATAVLRGLIYMLVQQQPCFMSHIRDKSFEGENAWFALLRVFTNILDDPQLQRTYLIIDALDECTSGLDRLLRLLVQKSSAYSHVKWVVSSRNWPNIEKELDGATQLKLRLDSNEARLSGAVNFFIQYKINELIKRNNYSAALQDAIKHHLVSKANGTFLWVALVCKELMNVSKRHVRKQLLEFPSGLDTVYERMWNQINKLGSRSCDGQACKSLLGVIMTVYRPVTLDELASCIDLPEGDYETSEEIIEALEEILGLCGSFLTLRGRTISLVHQSANDYLMKEAFLEIFPDGVEKVHHSIFSKSLKSLTRTLHRDIYGLVAPGYPIDQVHQPEPDPLAAMRYSCVYWVDHLSQCFPGKNASEDSKDNGLVESFFRQDYLHWLEALSLSRSLFEGVASMVKLEYLLQSTAKDSRLLDRVQDARRFILYHKMAIKKHPLQVYASGLIFNPGRSITGIQFGGQQPAWIIRKPTMEEGWNACLQTLEGHSDTVNSVVFSHDSKLLASASYDATVKVWNASSGQCLYTLEGHGDRVNSVAFSHDSKILASASHDATVRVWNASSGQYLQTLQSYRLQSHRGSVNSVAFSHDSKLLASASHDAIIKVWYTSTGQCFKAFKSHCGSVNSVAFSHDSKLLASASHDATIKVWNFSSGQCLYTLEGHNSGVNSVSFSYDSKLLASASADRTVKLWDSRSSQCLQTLKGHNSTVNSVSFSYDSKLLASASDDRTVKLWDSRSSQCLQTLESHSSIVNSVLFSHDSKLLASRSSDNTIKVWDARSGRCLQTLEGHPGCVNSVVFSHDSKLLASVSYNTIKVWNTSSGQCLQTLHGYNNEVSSFAFSYDSKLLASASHDSTIKISDARSGELLQILKGHRGSVDSVAFSHDSKFLASASHDSKSLAPASHDTTIKVWDAGSGQCLQTLRGHLDWVNSVVFSHESKVLASVSYKYTIKVWNASSGQCLQTLRGHSCIVDSIVFSRDSKLLASASRDASLKVWDVRSGQLLQALNTGRVTSLKSFNTTKSYLETSNGTICLSFVSGMGPTTTIHPEVPRYKGYGVSSDGTYITWNTENLLWLPPEYRPETFAISQAAVCFGCASGQVLLFIFDSQNLPC